MASDVPDVQELRVLDLDGDLDHDVVVRQTNAIGWFANDGNGNFSPLDTIHVSMDGLDAFDFADTQGDGGMDLVIGDRGADAIQLLLNDGAGEFGVPQVVVQMNGGFVGRLHLADMFGGAEPELLYMSSGIFVLVNEGGAFGEAEVVSTGGVNFDLQVLDIDGDGDLDVAKFTGLTPALGLLLNPGVAGEPWEEIQQGFGNSVGGQPVQALDVDGDGNTDLANAANHVLQWWQFPLVGTGPFELVGGTVDGSSVSLYRRGWTAHLGCGPGASMLWTDSIGEPVQWTTYDAVLEDFGPVSVLSDLPSFQAIHSGDLDGDGKEDLVLWDGELALSWYRNLIDPPLISLTLPFDTILFGEDPIALSGGEPQGGFYVIDQDTVIMFDPSGHVLGEMVPVHYTFTDLGSGCSGTAVDTVLINGTVGIGANRSTMGLGLRPNPTSGEVRFCSQVNGVFHIFNGVGALVQHGSVRTGDVFLNVGTLPAGVYWLVVSDETSIQREPLAITR